jgi:hypothetical protein
MPVEVMLDNGSESARAAVRVETGTPQFPAPLFRLPEVLLPAGAHRRAFLYPMPPRAGQAVRLALLVSGREAARAEAPATGMAPLDRLLVAAGGNVGTLQSLARTPLAQGPGGSATPAYLYVGTLPAASVPDRAEGFGAADALFLADVSADELTAGQQRAIRAWVLSGGHLILAGGTGWQRLRAPFYHGLLPVQLTGSTVLRAASGLGRLVDGAGPRFPEPLLAAVSRPLPGAQVLAREGEVPLVVRARSGLGQVTFLALDPLALAFRSWDYQKEFWRALVPRRAGLSFVGETLQVDLGEPWQYQRVTGLSPLVSRPVSQALQSVSQADLPSFWLVAGFLAAYVVALVPLNYLFLRWRGRREWAWLTSPAIMAVFAVGAYGVGCAMRGNRVLLVRVGIVEAAAESPVGRSVTYAGLFSPQRASYHVQAESPDTLLLPLTGQEQMNGVVVAGEPDRLEEFHLDVWEMGTVRATGTTDLGGGIRVSRRADGLLSVRNATPFDLEDCYVLDRDRLLPIGSSRFARGESWTEGRARGSTGGRQPGALLPLQVGANLTGSPEEKRLKSEMLQSFTTSRYGEDPGLKSGLPHPVLIGWLRGPVAGLLVDGQSLPGPSATLFLIHLNS